MKKIIIFLLLLNVLNIQAQTVVQTKAQWTKSMDSVVNVAVTRIQASLFAVSPQTALNLTKYDSTVNALKIADSIIRADGSKLTFAVSEVSADSKARLAAIEGWQLSAKTDLQNAIDLALSNEKLLQLHTEWIDDKQIKFNQLYK